MSDTSLRDRLSWLLRDAETTVDADTDQDAVFIANLSLAGFRDTLQQAMAALSPPALEGMPVAWSLDGFICDDDGRAIGTDETQIHWGSENPDPDEGWQPLYAAPAPAQQAVTDGWIPVGERLPTEEDYADHGDVLVRYLYIDDAARDWDIGESYHEADYEHNGGWSFGSCQYAHVSHWMPKSRLLAALAPNAAGDTPPATQENK